MDENERIRYSNVSGPLFFMLDITTACNFRCLHCYNSSGEKCKDEMSNEEIVNVAQQIAEFKPRSVCLCGGETMLRDNIYEIIKILKPNTGIVNMVSNGSLLNERNVKLLKDAGIDGIQISVDGINAMQHDTFRVYNGAFEKAINAIKIIRGFGIEVSVSFVPNKMNHRTFKDFLIMMNDLGVARVRIMPLIPMGRGSTIDSLILSPEEYVNLQLSIEVNKPIFRKRNMEIEWGDPIDHLYRLPNNEIFGYRSMQFEIKANGDIGISAYLPIKVGNIRHHSLREYWENGYDNIWYNDKFIKYRDRIKTVYDINKLGSELSPNEKYYIDIMKGDK